MSIFYTRPGVTSYGHRLGILQIECNQPFIPGDIGNAQTWDFPVLYKVVEGCSIQRLILDNDPSLEKQIVQAALDLKKQGVEAITSNCGFMIRHQKAVEQALDIPVFLSSLLELPRIARAHADPTEIAIITASGTSLDEKDLACAGWNGAQSVYIYGMDHYDAFAQPFIEDCGYVDIEAMKGASRDMAKQTKKKHPNLGAVLLECAVLPPYTDIFSKTCGVPVYSFYTMITRKMRA